MLFILLQMKDDNVIFCYKNLSEPKWKFLYCQCVIVSMVYEDKNIFSGNNIEGPSWNRDGIWRIRYGVFCLVFPFF